MKIYLGGLKNMDQSIKYEVPNSADMAASRLIAPENACDAH
ncbi:hypothetical protein SAMN04490355_1002128 [Pelosinus propionicus DSM 13327]|uniref:Uncharacterized protein n=1 Tax=Pelosinus propionicus DSM 13327 TaxID=1123291 RepID=A0A1I4H4D9_9FIRM|nr:hypothetical protein SAMN04490355_1002128 [Pelosinus propionicus DSM 13327]